jgi:hypothetical protein
LLATARKCDAFEVLHLTPTLRMKQRREVWGSLKTKCVACRS